MARIRSVHPGFFTDDVAALLSERAQLLLIGIWTQCDDQGVFEWKPGQLKLRLKPGWSGTPAEVAVALDELEAADMLKKITVGNVSYGIVRNFRKWQRPKKPTKVYPLPPEHRAYVGLARTGAALNGGEFPTGGELDGSDADEFGTGSGELDGDETDPSGEPDPPSSEPSSERRPRKRRSSSEIGQQRKEGGGRNEPPIGVHSPSSRESSPVMPGAREAAEIEKWTPRLAGYRPWEGLTAWEPFWGLRPDSAGRNPLIPEVLLKPWLADYRAWRNQPAGGGGTPTHEARRD